MLRREATDRHLAKAKLIVPAVARHLERNSARLVCPTLGAALEVGWTTLDGVSNAGPAVSQEMEGGTAGQ